MAKMKGVGYFLTLKIYSSTFEIPFKDHLQLGQSSNLAFFRRKVGLIIYIFLNY